MTERPAPITAAALLENERFVRALLRSLIDETQIDDVVQETWVRALTRPPSRGGSLRAWLGRVATNIARNLRVAESRRRRRETSAARTEATDSTARLVERLGRQRAVVGAVLDLEEPYRETVLLRFFDELPPREIAARMDVPVATVQTRLRRAKERLREALEPEVGGDLTLWALAVWPALDGKHVAVAGASAGLSTGALIMSLQMKLVAVGVVGIGMAAAIYVALDEPPVVATSDRSQVASGSTDGPVASRELRPQRSPADQRDATASAADTLADTVDAGAPSRDGFGSVDPGCGAARLAEALDALERARHDNEAARGENLGATIAACGDVAVPVVRGAMLDRPDIASDLVQIIAQIGSDLAVRSTLALLMERKMPDASLGAIAYDVNRRSRLGPTFVSLLGEEHLPPIGEALTGSFRPGGRSTAAKLLRYIPKPRTIEILTDALEDERDADVINTILESLWRLRSEHGLDVDLDRVLKLVDLKDEKVTWQLAMLVAVARPWPDALAWIVTELAPTERYPYEAMIHLLKEGGPDAERAVIDAAARLRRESRSKGEGIRAESRLLWTLNLGEEHSVAAPALERTVLDATDYDDLGRDLFKETTDNAKGNLILALSHMPESEACYRTLNALIFPGTESETMLSRRLHGHVWDAMGNLVGDVDSPHWPRAADLTVRAFEQRPEARGEIVEMFEKRFDSRDGKRREAWRDLIGRLESVGGPDWQATLDDLKRRFSD